MALNCKIYVRDLPRDASEKEVDRAFSYYGALRSVWVARNPPGFAFVEFEDERDAEDAVRGLDGTNICGVRVRVEQSSGKVRPKPWLNPRGSRGPPPRRRQFDPKDRCYLCGESGHYAYDCRTNKGGGRRSSRRSRSRSRSPYQSRRRSYSRSRSRERRRSRSHSYSKSRSRDRGVSNSGNRSRSRDRYDDHGGNKDRYDNDD